jgi:hypothetical protein
VVVANQGFSAGDAPQAPHDDGGATFGWPDHLVRRAVELVLTVARLGEADLFGWWQCHGLSRTGRYVLERSFPRTWHSVALEIDMTSAARRHDGMFSGRDSALHLFSGHLPFRRLASAWLAEQKTRRVPDPLFDRLGSLCPQDAIQHLRALAGPGPLGKVRGAGLWLGEAGPAQLVDGVSTCELGQVLAASYATVRDPFLAPYFDLVP